MDPRSFGAWAAESLRRAVIVGVLVGSAIQFDAISAKVGLLAVTFTFLFFLFRNPEYWLRRLSYACTMASVAVLAGIGSALRVILFGQVDTERTDAGLFISLGDGEIATGVVLIIAGLLFAYLETRQRATQSSESQRQVVFLAKSCETNMQLTCRMALRNDYPHVVTIGHAEVVRRGILSRLFVHDVTVVSRETLEIRGEPPVREEVDFSAHSPVVIPPHEWKWFVISMSFQDRLERVRFIAVRALLWVLGCKRRLFELRLGPDKDSVEIHRTFMALV